MNVYSGRVKARSDAGEGNTGDNLTKRLSYSDKNLKNAPLSERRYAF